MQAAFKAYLALLFLFCSILFSTSAASARSSLAGTPLCIPTTGTVTQSFSQSHKAIDISGASKKQRGPAIYAASGGKVLFVGKNSIDPATYGVPNHTVVIDHGLIGGKYTVGIYVHMGKNARDNNGVSLSYVSSSITKGKEVVRGAYLGDQGSAGVATGTHLHFEVRQRDTPYTEATGWTCCTVDPRTLIVEGNFPETLTANCELPPADVLSPTLSNPAENSSFPAGTSITLSWNGNSDEYFVELTGAISKNSGWTRNTTWNLGAPSNGTYFWHVKTRKGAVESGWSDTWSFTITQPSIRKPNLVGLSNGSSLTYGVNATLSWEGDADEYYAERWGVSSGDLGWTRNKTWVLSTPTVGTHYWRVKARKGGVESGWSETWSFTITPQSVAKPSLVAPANGASLTYGTNVTLSWEGDADEYYAEESGAASGNSGWTRNKSWGLGATTAGIHNWHVKARKGGVESGWSDTWAFTIIQSAPSKPYPVGPPNASSYSSGTNVTLTWGGDGDKYYAEELGTASRNSGWTRSKSWELGAATVGIHNWHVKARKDGVESDWSETWSFTVVTLPAGDSQRLEQQIAAKLRDLSQPLPVKQGWRELVNIRLTGVEDEYYLLYESGLIQRDLAFKSCVAARNFLKRLDVQNAKKHYDRCLRYEMDSYYLIGLAEQVTLDANATFESAKRIYVGARELSKYGWTLACGLECYRAADWFFTLTDYAVDASLEGADEATRQLAVKVMTEQILGTVGFSNMTNQVASLAYQTWIRRELVRSGVYVTEEVAQRLVSNWLELERMSTPKTAPNPLSAPTPTSPSNGTINTSTQPTFQWTAVSGASCYWLLVATNSSALPTDINARSCPGCIIAEYTQSASYTHDSLLQLGTTYYWKVQPLNSLIVPIQQGQFSARWNFTTALPPANKPTLKSPANGSSFEYGTSVTLTWDGDADEYYAEKWGVSSGNSGWTRDKTWIQGTPTVGTHYWRVKARKSGVESEWSDTWNFTIAQVPVNKPTLKGPANGASITYGTSVTLTWDGGADEYYAEKWGASSGNSGWTRDRTWALGTPTVGTHYWRVKARKSGVESAWSDTWSFTTQVIPPPTLVNPSNGAANVSTQPTFQWTSVSGANRYWLLVATSQSALPTDINASSCPACVFEKYTSSTSYTHDSPLQAGVTYHWKVQPYNTTPPIQQGEYSSVWNFRTTPPPANRPTLKGPANSSSFVYGTSVTLTWDGDADEYLAEELGSFSGSSGWTRNKNWYLGTPMVGTHTWHVKARKSGVESGWSDTWSFTVSRSTFTLSGRVTNSAGNPLNGVVITLSGSSSGSTTTANGNFSFSGLFDGTYTVTPSLPGWNFSPRNRTVTINGSNVSGQDFVGTLVTFSVSGRVTTSSGSALGGVRLTISGPATGETYTDASGYYTFSGVYNGTWTIVPSLSGWSFSPPNRTVTISSTDASAQNFTGTADLLPAPTLVVPSNGATSISTQPTFQWAGVSGANRYWLLVATNPSALPTDLNAPSCSGCVIATYTSSTSYTHSSALQAGTTYYWKVQPFNNSTTPIQQGQYSATWSFTVSSPASAPSARLLSNTPIERCKWNVQMYLSGFAPNGLITVSSSYDEVECATGRRITSSWTQAYSTRTDQSGNLVIAYMHQGTGSYNYTFTDDRGNRATLPLSTNP